MKKTPIALIVDDPAPRVHVYWSHTVNHTSPEGTRLRPDVPNDFLDEFCDLVEKENLHGKFSIVPMAGAEGDIINGFRDYPDSEIADWLDTAKKRLGGYFSFCPEMLTHQRAVNLSNGSFYDMNEEEWSEKQDRTTLTPYIERALTMLKQVGIRAVGVTSPWGFGYDIEDEYALAISDAVYNVWGDPRAWYFLHVNTKETNVKPVLAYQSEDRKCVSVVATTNDMLWCSINTPETEVNDAYISYLADRILTEDGTKGAVAEAIARGSVPVIMEHWQSLYSNGSRAGLHALAIAANRINRHFGDRFEWTDCEHLAKLYY